MKMKKNKILLFVFCLVVITFYSLINYYFLMPKKELVKESDILYTKLKQDMDDLLNEKKIEYPNYEVIGSMILERNIYTFFDQIIINVGSNNGIKEKDAVLNQDGLIGIVSKVYGDYSYVDLITKNDLEISIKINDSYGIYKNGEINNIINYADINIDDQVYTSGLTNIIEGLNIGKVRSIDMDKYEIEKKIGVELRDLTELKFVYVLTSKDNK